jgi:uncharacterized protein
LYHLRIAIERPSTSTVGNEDKHWLASDNAGGVGSGKGSPMTVASDLLQRHIETLLSPGEWEALIADDIVWELPFAPALGHPGRLEGREAVVKHVNWFRGAVENFRFSDIRVYPWADSNGASGEVRARGRIKETGREYQQEYVFFLRATGGKIVWLREYFDPTRAAKAMDRQIT